MHLTGLGMLFLRINKIQSFLSFDLMYLISRMQTFILLIKVCWQAMMTTVNEVNVFG